MFKDRYILAATTIFIIAIQIILWPIILKLPNLPGQIVFWQTQVGGQRLAPTYYIWIIPATAIICWLINAVLGWKLYRRYPAITHLLFTVSAFIAAMAAITAIRTILIYTSLV